MTVTLDISPKHGEIVNVRSVDGPARRLKATEAAVTRFRTGLEGSRDYALAGRLSLRPRPVNPSTPNRPLRWAHAAARP